MTFDQILRQTESYYSEKVRAHGSTARGVDWNSPESQALRFDQLLTLCDPQAPCALNDYGCGYGALAGHMHARGFAVDYRGFDISAEMLARGRELYAGSPGVTFVEREELLAPADYTVASGVFNVRQGVDAAAWQAYVLHILDRMDALSARGFAFNVLTSYADPERMRPDLYYADPLFYFDYCKRHYSRSVALLHDYPLYEFTIIVRK